MYHPVPLLLEPLPCLNHYQAICSCFNNDKVDILESSIVPYATSEVATGAQMNRDTNYPQDVYFDRKYTMSNGDNFIFRDYPSKKKRQVFRKLNIEDAYQLTIDEDYGHIRDGCTVKAYEGHNVSIKWTNDSYLSFYVDSILVLNIQGYTTITRDVNSSN